MNMPTIARLTGALAAAALSAGSLTTSGPPATAAGPATAAAIPAGRDLAAYEIVTLPTGERLLRHGVNDAGAQEWRPMDTRELDGAQILRAGKRSFVFPRSVEHLIGPVLDPALFDANAIAASSAGRPVTVTLKPGARVETVPGVVIDSRSARRITGRITPESSATLGRVLRGADADTLFAGIDHIAPQQATPPPSRYPMHTLTIRVTGADGRPLDGARVVVACASDLDRFVGMAESVRGVAKVSVPRGTYVAAVQHAVSATDYRVALSPEFAVTEPESVRLDLRRATTQLRTRTAEPSVVKGRATLVRRVYSVDDGVRVLLDFGAVDNGETTVSFSPVAKPRFGTQSLYQFVSAWSPKGMTAGRYALLFEHAGDIPRRDIVQVAGPGNLARFDTTLHGPDGMDDGRFSRSALPESGGWGFIEVVDRPMRLTEYVTARRGVDAGGSYFQDADPDIGARGIFDQFAQDLRPGSRRTALFGRGPLHAGFSVPHEVCTTCTDGTTISVIGGGDYDAQGHGSTGDLTATPTQTWRISADETEVASGAGHLMAGASIPGGTRMLTVEIGLDHRGAPFTTSTRVNSRTAVPVSAARPDPALECFLPGRCRVLPFLTARYAVATDLFGHVAPGRQRIIVSLDRLGGFATRTARSLTLRLDYGSGWISVPLNAIGPGRYAADVTIPRAAAGRTSADLRFSAVTTDGARLDEHVEDAFLLRR